MKRIKVKGLPGTGKTTFLKNYIAARVSEGIDVRDIVFSSFSRSTALAILRMMSTLGYERRDLEYFRTLHSLAARILELTSSNRFVNDDDRKRFCKREGIQYWKARIATIDEIEEYGVTGEEYVPIEGNILFRWWQFLKKKYVKEREIKNAILQRSELRRVEIEILRNFHPFHLLDLYARWEKYKRSSGKWEYDDMLQYLVLNDGVNFSARYFIVDEAQDLNPLQYELVKLLSKGSEELILAGDENQAIYFFNAADSNIFRGFTAHENLILPQSYRVPRVIWEYACKIADYMGDTEMRDVKPTKMVGEMHYIDYDSALEILKGFDNNEEVFLLFRTHKMIKKFDKDAFHCGVYYKGFGRSVTVFNSLIFYNIYNLLRKLCRKEEPTENEVRHFLISVPARYFVKRGLKSAIKKQSKELKEQWLGQSQLEKLYTSIKAECIDDIKEIITDSKTRIKAKDILLSVSSKSAPIRENTFIGTYYASKGLETQVCFEFDYFPRRDANIMKEEAPLIFTGTTRAREQCYVVSPEGYFEDGLIYDMMLG